MKFIYVLLLILLNSAVGFSQYAEFTFLEGKTHKWKKVDEGVQLEHYYVFQNTGEDSLRIQDALVSCTCTTVDYPQQPVPPGGIDSIRVHFDTNEKYYLQKRLVKLKANTQFDEELRFKVFVKPKS